MVHLVQLGEAEQRPEPLDLKRLVRVRGRVRGRGRGRVRGRGRGRGRGRAARSRERLLMDQVAQPKTLLLRQLALSAGSICNDLHRVCTDLYRVCTGLHPVCTGLHPCCTGLHPVCTDLAFRMERVDLRRLVRARAGVKVR